MAPRTTVTTVNLVVNTACSVTISTTIDANLNAFINAITNIVTTLEIIIGRIHTITDFAVNTAVTAVYECRAGGRNGSQGTCIVSKVLICVFFLGHTSLKCGCFPTRD